MKQNQINKLIYKSIGQITAEEAKIRFPSLIDEVAVSHEPVQIIGKINSAILISKRDWQSIQKILHLSSEQI